MGKRLTARFVQTVKEPGKYGDGDGSGMFLLVKKSGRKSYVQRIMIHGKVRDIGLGSMRLVSLAEARAAALENRKLARAGGDPMALRAGRLAPTFTEAADKVIGLHSETWRDGGKTASQWRASLRDYAMPLLGSKSVDRITSMDVMSVLLPIWNTKRETARRVRQRIGAIMKWSIAEGHRADNPAGEAISAALPRNGSGRKHYAALAHSEVAGALAKVGESGAWWATKSAFELLVLTAARSGEVRGMRWSEILDRVWTIPGNRMKAGRDHRVPLSDRALEVLAAARQYADGSGLVFPSVRGKALSDSTISKLLKENAVGAVPHGFRSSFRDWAAECSNAPREVAEEALAHVNPNRVESAYRRSDLFERRRTLMQEWADYLDSDLGIFASD